ncbi:hypothetical protein HKX48_000225 [Thoreauomyces humboldtii]|nr:hypothetical protein HKX48_000225 [Thoreauomyces humboldtii]
MSFRQRTAFINRCLPRVGLAQAIRRVSPVASRGLRTGSRIFAEINPVTARPHAAVGNGRGVSVLVGLALISLWGQQVLAESFDPIEPVTKRPVPLLLENPLNQKPSRLVGLGVRAVTFLNVSVYAVGFYLDETALSRIASSPRWKDYSSANLDAFVEDLVRGTGSVSVRVEPVRNTDGPHLRNGFLRILQKQIGIEEAKGSLTDDSSEKKAILGAMDEFRAAFPTGKVAKGEVLVLTKTEAGTLRLEYNGTELVEIHNRWLAERMLEGYLCGQKPISPKLRESVAVGLTEVLRGNQPQF